MKKEKTYIDKVNGICIEAKDRLNAWLKIRNICRNLQIEPTRSKDIERLELSPLHEAILTLSNDKTIFGHDEDGRFSVNTGFISHHAPVYFDCENSYHESILAMLDYFETCMGRPKSILKDSLMEIGYPDVKLFRKHIEKQKI